MRKLTKLAVLLAILLMIVPHVIADDTVQIMATEQDPAVAVAWMDLLYRRVEAQGINAPAASRVYAYAGIALYEAVAPGIPGNYSMAGQIPHMPDMPWIEDGVVYDWRVIANATLVPVYKHLLGEGNAETVAAIDALYAKWADTLKAETSEAVFTRSDAHGTLLGEALVEWIAEDNYIESRSFPYELPTGNEMFYVLTTPGTQTVEPYWGSIRPFGLSFAEQCHVYPNMEFSTDRNSPFYAQSLEVKDVGDKLTDWEMETARYWVDTPGETGTPAGHWVAIEIQLVEQLNLPLGRTAEMFALVGTALGDAFISAWSLKYQAMLLRPETYIQRYIRRSWQPYIQTPPFPEYPSGHSVVSGAASEVLRGMFNTVAFTDRTHIIYQHENLQRSYTSFEAAAYEAAISRLYGGIHYRFAIENGLRQGRCIGDYILKNVRLRPRPQGGD